MPPHNLINLETPIILGPECRPHRDKVGRLSHFVHNNQNGVMLYPSPHKTNHEVNVNGLPLPCRNLNHLNETTRLMVLCLNLLTIGTLFHILNNVLLYAIPLIDVLEVMIHLGGTWMYQILVTMGLCNNLGP